MRRLCILSSSSSQSGAPSVSPVVHGCFAATAELPPPPFRGEAVLPLSFPLPAEFVRALLTLPREGTFVEALFTPRVVPPMQPARV